MNLFYIIALTFPVESGKPPMEITRFKGHKVLRINGKDNHLPVYGLTNWVEVTLTSTTLNLTKLEELTSRSTYLVMSGCKGQGLTLDQFLPDKVFWYLWYKKIKTIRENWTFTIPNRTTPFKTLSKLTYYIRKNYPIAMELKFKAHFVPIYPYTSHLNNLKR